MPAGSRRYELGNMPLRLGLLFCVRLGEVYCYCLGSAHSFGVLNPGLVNPGLNVLRLSWGEAFL